VEALVDGLRRGPLGVGADGDRRPMGVGPGDHQDAVSGQAVVAGEDVGRQVGADDIADVDVGIGVRPSHRDEDVVAHGAPRKKLSAISRQLSA